MPELKLNLGCGKNILEGWVNCDRALFRGVDKAVDLDACDFGSLPFEDDEVDEFLMSHVLEHITNTLPLMQELWRIAKPDAICTVRVPYGSSNEAYEDPTHVRQYFTGSFMYFAQPMYWRADYGYRGDWQPEEILLSLDERRYGKASKQQIMGEIMGYRNVVLEMVAVLRAVKPAREQRAELQVAPTIKLILVDDHRKFLREVE